MCSEPPYQSVHVNTAALCHPPLAAAAAGPRLAVREGVLPGHAVVPPAHGRGAAPPLGQEEGLRRPLRLSLGPLDASLATLTRWRCG